MKPHICGNCGGILPKQGPGCKYMLADRKHSRWIGKKPERERKKVLLCAVYKDTERIGIVVSSVSLLEMPFGGILAYNRESFKIEVISIFSWDRWNAARLRNTLIYHGLRTPHHRAVIS